MERFVELNDITHLMNSLQSLREIKIFKRLRGRTEDEILRALLKIPYIKSWHRNKEDYFGNISSYYQIHV